MHGDLLSHGGLLSHAGVPHGELLYNVCTLEELLNGARLIGAVRCRLVIAYVSVKMAIFTGGDDLSHGQFPLLAEHLSL